MAKRTTEIIVLLIIVATVVTAVYTLSTNQMVTLSDPNHLVTLK